MTPRELDGWAQEEVHEHFDAAGNKTGWTVVTREPRVSPSDREQMFALDDYESSLCGCGCGQPLAEAMDKNRAFKVRAHKCRAKAAIDRVQRQAREKAEAHKLPDGWDDGTTWLIEHSFIPDEKGGTDRG